MKALGAQVFRTPTEAASDSPNSHISKLDLKPNFSKTILGLAKRLNREIPNSVILDQYSNPNNPLAHYEGTAEEIIQDCGDHLDMVVIGAGTGGTISGVAKKLKEKYSGIIVVGVDPIGSILANPSQLDKSTAPYQVEGIGYDFIPKVLDHSLIDSWIVTKDSDSFRLARRLIRSEGLLCGGSSGSVTWAAIQAIKAYNFHKDPSKRVLIILPDSVRNYMTKFLSSDWMFAHQFMDTEEFLNEEGYNFVPLSYETSNIKTFPVLALKLTDSISQVISLLQSTDFPKQCPAVIDPLTNKIIGNFDSLKLFQRILKEGKETVTSLDILRFTNKDFLSWKISDDTKMLFAAFAANTPAYLTDLEDNPILDAQGRVQSINPFNLLQ